MKESVAGIHIKAKFACRRDTLLVKLGDCSAYLDRVGEIGDVDEAADVEICWNWLCVNLTPSIRFGNHVGYSVVQF